MGDGGAVEEDVQVDALGGLVETAQLEDVPRQGHRADYAIERAHFVGVLHT